MQVRVVTASGEKVKPVRALVRYIGMNLAMVPLPWGYVPIPLKRLGISGLGLPTRAWSRSNSCRSPRLDRNGRGTQATDPDQRCLRRIHDVITRTRAGR